MISRYPGPATQARSAMSRGSPEKNGGFDMITSNKQSGSSPDIRSDRIAVTRSPRPLAQELSVAALTALGLMSSATTVAPARAAANANMPLPVPTSATVLPARSIVDRNRAKNSLVKNNLGGNTVG